MTSSTTDEDDVLTYLKLVSQSIDVLSACNTFEPQDPSSQSAEYYMDRIARNLLFNTCDPINLSQPVPRILMVESLDSKNNPCAARVKNRTDALRNIYRTMAPIALDVSARISAIVTSSSGAVSSSSSQFSTNVFVLFSIWLPVAPQIAQIVMDLFQWEKFGCPLDYLYMTGIIEKDGEDENAMDVDGTSPAYYKSVVVVSEASYCVIKFFAERSDHASMKKWWEWTRLFGLLGCREEDSADEKMDVDIDIDVLNDDEPKGWAQRAYSCQEAIRWFTVRSIGFLLNLTPTSRGFFVQKLGLDNEMVPWMPHPWVIVDEEAQTQNDKMRGIVTFVRDGETFESKAPTPCQVRQIVSLPPSLVHLGQGIILPCKSTVCEKRMEKNDDTPNEDLSLSDRRGLIMTETTSRNLSLLGSALCFDPYPRPILVCGPRGSGKSSLIREIAHYCSGANSKANGGPDELLELHVDEETDSKTLLGSYAATDIPGEFTWRPGALTNAVRSGKWVLLEDVESCPAEIQAAIVKLFEERILPLGVGKSEKCHPNFRMFGTCTTGKIGTFGNDDNRRLRKCVISAGSGGKKLLHPGLWSKVHVDPLPYSELQVVSRDLFPSLPVAISEAALNVLRQLDKSGRVENIVASKDAEEKKELTDTFNSRTPILGNGRHSSVRDLVKLLYRISCIVHFEPGATFCTESQRILCMAESFDIFASWCPCRFLRKDFVSLILAPIWGVTATAGIRYIEDRQPQIKVTGEYIEVGRSTIRRPPKSNESVVIAPRSNFADTNYSLRLMESAGVSIAQNEPTLLVGETGCGKTTIIQRLASLSGHELVVQNLSLQTDSTDLLGGYRPLEIRHIARTVYTDFVQLFVSSFSKSQNAQFLDYVTAAYEKGQWKRLSQCFQRAAKMGLDKMKLQKKGSNGNVWLEFKRTSERFEKQRLACDTGLAFVFTEGALVDAIRSGKWVLLDEINLASSETLERLCGLLDDAKGSVTLTEKGDSEALRRHPDFRIFAAMNPATDAGKKDLPSSLRSRFTEIYVDELIDPTELRTVAASYLSGVIAPSDTPLEHTESVIASVDVYLKCRELSEKTLVDGSGQRPRYTLRTMCRALSGSCNLISKQRFGVKRALLEGFELGFEGALDEDSRNALKILLSSTLGKGLSKKELDHPGRRPGSKADSGDFVLSKPFWICTGSLEKVDWSEASSKSSRSRFVLTPSMAVNLRRLTRAVASGPWPVLLEGPTSAGKTTMVEFLAARCGHRCVRINNHEHTDVQEYTGSYASDPNGKLCFREGILVQALRKGHWVILDELNLAPSEVLEALNRLLDDNRELYLAEINEVVKPHPNFRLFATQNPSGAYGGRKPLSRAFRNRFVEMHVGDIPEQEMVTILELRCKCPPSHAKLLVKVMSSLRKRRSKSGVFRGKDGLITPRDLLRWAERKVVSKEELALQGWMLLAERLRDEDEKNLVKEIIEEHMKVHIDCNELYFGKGSESRRKLALIGKMDEAAKNTGLDLRAIAPTKSILRLLTLVERCVEQKEPVLLVGDTGCGKTTVVQILSVLFNRNLQIVNCHASTETSDLLGGLRPLRGRKMILQSLEEKMRDIISEISCDDFFESIDVPMFLSLKETTTSPQNVANQIAMLAKNIRALLPKVNSDERMKSDRCKKRRKVDDGSPGEVVTPVTDLEKLKKQLDEVDKLFQQHASLFEWVDGPLVDAMKKGDLFLLDEMSLAEDAVLERLNSVLEPSRTLVLAEKGGDLSVDEDSSDNTEIKAHENFRVFATMNPGGDFGKRELSPALRSRFTEIWVPSVTDLGDIDLVLGQTMNASFERYQVQHITSDFMKKAKGCMLTYVNWFNIDICSKPMSTCADFLLSLRDVLAWARFFVETICKNEDFDVWSAYAHGASLMHLDGLGLGTGLSHEDASGTKKMAKTYLSNQIATGESVAGFEDEFDGIDESKLYDEGKFGVHPFRIKMGVKKVPPSLGFKLSAPTTGMNLRRVLRAMQISKPILLEGSPGVGKTSLISALATASGHELVRINLSEQTDISDLMGSDLPMPDEALGDEENTSTGSSFKWCDGALLKAIKNGDWVLLDELNLASQSVLEGLNSCLDHRASVYIPELGETFHCPLTFRIFAAQNPLAQGGGRKGLPKSFLNRFTKVYVEALSKDDLQGIVEAKFPMLTPALVEKIVNFNNCIQKDIESRKYGQLGSPWEFNLRDVFRWCDLISNHYQNHGTIEQGAFSDTIYMQRLRCDNDRFLLAKRYEECFGSRDCIRDDPTIEVLDNNVRVGMAVLKRNTNILSPSESIILGSEPSLLKNLVRPMEAVALCVEMSWPCLLVGGSSSGKSTILKSLAESCNMHLEEVALTPSSDVNELIGCFEQVDAAEVEARLLHNLEKVCNDACLTLVGTDKELQLLQEISSTFNALSTSISRIRSISTAPVVINEDEILGYVKDLISIAQKGAHLSDRFHQVCNKEIHLAVKDLATFTKKISSKKDSHGVHFRWFDGVLVNALENGYWLHLENVNFCPSSVLDRLNPLMETDGELILTECGIKEDEKGSSGGTSRIVKPHPNFRIFLSMNPASGEVSRAMRNRCIEVSLLSPGVSSVSDQNTLPSNIETLDSIDTIWSSGVRSSELAKLILTFHQHEFYSNDTSSDDNQPPRSLSECTKLTIDSLNRGFVGKLSLKRPQQIAYEVHHEEFDSSLLFDIDKKEVENMIEIIRGRDLFGRATAMNRVMIDARLLKSISHENAKLPLGLTGFEERQDSVFVKEVQDMQKFAPPLKVGDSRFACVKSQLLSNFVRKSKLCEASSRSVYLEGYCDGLSSKIRFVTHAYLKAANDCPNEMSNFVKVSSFDRLAQLFDEYDAYEPFQSLDSCEDFDLKKLHIIELSYCIHENKVDRSHVSCPVTPILYPFFLSLDSYFIEMGGSAMMQGGDNELIDKLQALLSSRDRLWQFLYSSPQMKSSFLGFDNAGFFVHWNWLKKRMYEFNCIASGLISANLNQSKRHLDLIMMSIDRAAHIHSSDLRSLSSSFWKRMGHPLVPAKANDSISIRDLKTIAKNFTILSEEDFGFLRILSGKSASLSAGTLLDRQYNPLALTAEVKSETLIALSMAYWATTDEMAASTRLKRLDYDAAKISKMLSQKLNSLQEDFAKKLRSCTVDTTIKTVENQLNLEDLEMLRDGNVNDSDGDSFLQVVLTNFGWIQTSQIVEFVCAKEEEWLVENLAKTMRLLDDKLMMQNLRQRMAPRIKKFIDNVKERTIWPVCDLRPYQSILWILESDSVDPESSRRLFNSCHSTLICTLSRHQWCNSFNDLNCISQRIASPSFWDSCHEERHRVEEEVLVMKDLANFSGLPRLRQNVISESIFRLQGFDKVKDLSSQNLPYFTLENHKARSRQANDLARFLSSDFNALNHNGGNFETILYLTENMIDALVDSFDSKDDFELFKEAALKALENSFSPDEFEQKIDKCNHQIVSKLSRKVLIPLLSLLNDSKMGSSQDLLSLATIYLGILRFHLALPASPLDPGEKPAAKVAQWDHYLHYVGSKLLTIRMENGLLTGNFEPKNEEVEQVMEDLNYGYRKRGKQEKKRVERPLDARPFYDLFREVHHFANTVASPEKILELVEEMSKAEALDENSSSYKQKEVNWQSTAVSFLNNMLMKYPYHEDVTSPIIASIAMIQHGLRSIFHFKMSQQKSILKSSAQLQDQLLRYPNVKLYVEPNDTTLQDISTSFSFTDEIKSEIAQPDKMRKNCQFSVLLSLLANTSLLKGRNIVTEDRCTEISSWAFKSIVEAWSAASLGSTDINLDETEEEKLERQFREMFPDHAKDFNKIIQAIEAREFGGDNDDMIDNIDDEIEVDTLGDFAVSEEQIRFLCDIHRELFSTQKAKTNDSLRIRSFMATYTAAGQLNNSVFVSDTLQSENKRLACHSYALGLNAKVDSGSSISFESFMDSNTTIDFHKDPNPIELQKADEPLRSLLMRVSQLMRAFPGNSILLSIGQIVERIRQLDMKNTSLGKTLTGLEVILKKAQEWEQHASERVALGESLRKVSGLVAQWRKLELQSWSSLLNVRDSQHELFAKRHWIRLYKLLILDMDNILETATECQGSPEDLPIFHSFPRWVWKGSASKLTKTASIVLDSPRDESFLDLLKVLDTFILTSGIGQFHERLKLLDSFACQLHQEMKCAKQINSRKTAKAIAVSSLVDHYRQFSTMISSLKENLSNPIETKLKNEVKLAKWDEQSYYALAESAEKSHRKLMMIVHEYEVVLETSVAKILEEHFLKAIRSHSEVGSGTSAEPVTEVPSNVSLFPDLDKDGELKSIKERMLKEQLIQFRKKDASTTLVEEHSKYDKYILGMQKYGRKMDKLFNRKSNQYHGCMGVENVSNICESIFDRINVLREKGTKQMKQRALVDLFKILKKQGYSSMKWSVPKEVREMASILQMRSPVTSGLDSAYVQALDGAESYFRKCTIENSRLRSEVQLMGSAYMSKREMDLMVGFSDHGLLLLCQQRSNITKAIYDIRNVLDLLQVLDRVHEKLPNNQGKLTQAIHSFDSKFNTALETLRQNFLMSKTISNLSDAQNSEARDIIGMLEGYYSKLDEVYTPFEKFYLVTNDQVAIVKTTQIHLESVLEGISLCDKMARKSQIFPNEIFIPSIDAIESALSCAAAFIGCHAEPQDSTQSTEEDALLCLSDLIQKTLLAAQVLNDGTVALDGAQNGDDDSYDENIKTLWETHSEILVEWNSLDLHNFTLLLRQLINGLRSMDPNTSITEGISSQCCGLLLKVLDECQRNLSVSLSFYRDIAKFEYIKLRIFRILVAKGFCADDVEEGGDADGEGDGNMKFEDDVEGTGMGEGDGKNDVTDQIENEEQLLGLKGDEEKETTQEQKELNEDEAETGMEMENEFDGEMFDVPDKKEDENDDKESDGEEELDREMGDGNDPNEEVVDEKMWDEDDAEDEENQEQEEKFEKDSKVAGEALEDELRTKEDDEGGKGEENNEKVTDDTHDDQAAKKDDEQDDDQGADGADAADDKEEEINDDFEDNYEDKHDGVEVRNEEDGQEPDGEGDEEDDGIDLNDDMNLDDGESADEGETGGQVGEEEEVDEENDDDSDIGNDGTHEIDQENEEDEEDNEMDSEALQSAHQTLGDDDQMNGEDEKDENAEEDDGEPEIQDTNDAEVKHEDSHGVASKNGADSVKRPEEEEDAENEEAKGEEDEDEENGAGEGEKDEKESGAGQSDANSGEIQDGDQGSGTKPSSTSMDAPNPFRDPGDAEEFWHKKLNVISEADDEDSPEANTNDEKNDQSNPDGDFEFSSKDQDNSTQVLSGVSEDDAPQMKEPEDHQHKDNTEDDSAKQDAKKDESKMTKRQGAKQEISKADESTVENKPSDSDNPQDDEVEDQNMAMEEENDNASIGESVENDEDAEVDNKVVTDLAQLQMHEGEEKDFQTEDMIEEETHAGVSLEEAEEARKKWSELQSETNGLSRRLCEKLRLVMEPLVASKLRGDYRTGKRINMKRVIGYIASGYRKDKIWLKRTKPGKRDYRVLLAVDDSESMKNGAGDMALTALTTLANGMSQLEIGELGIASFGEEMKLLHPFHAPFTSSSGVDLVSNFKFSDKRTRTALCVESALAALESQNGSSSMQLVFMISDGRIERDGRERLRRVVREMTEKNILLVMIIVEGDDKGQIKMKDSIVNMKEVSFQNGKPKVKHFIDDYPFPYYMVLQDMHSLPEVLGDALKQWFEMMAQNQSQG
uniref:Midasin n=1 Tax=Chaetoceros debilis TaxID=122233 RepID=A0A7S3VEM6_9STRA